jgi:hypothetical protein
MCCNEEHCTLLVRRCSPEARGSGPKTVSATEQHICYYTGTTKYEEDTNTAYCLKLKV